MKKGKYFIIKTKINPDLVLEVHLGGEEDVVGVSSQIRDWVGNNDHQMWYYDYNYRTLVNKKNNLLLDYSGELDALLISYLWCVLCSSFRWQNCCEEFGTNKIWEVYTGQ